MAAPQRKAGRLVKTKTVIRGLNISFLDKRIAALKEEARTASDLMKEAQDQLAANEQRISMMKDSSAKAQATLDGHAYEYHNLSTLIEELENIKTR